MSSLCRRSLEKFHKYYGCPDSLELKTAQTAIVDHCPSLVDELHRLSAGNALRVILLGVESPY